MTNDELNEIEEAACLMPMTICSRNFTLKNIPTFLLVEFYSNVGYRNYAIHRPAIGAELDRRFLEVNIP